MEADYSRIEILWSACAQVRHKGLCLEEESLNPLKAEPFINHSYVIHSKFREITLDTDKT